MWNRGGRKEDLGKITDLERAVDGLASTVRLLKTEWEDTLNRLNRIASRLNARDRREKGKQDHEDASGDPNGEAPRAQHPLGTHAQLNQMRRGRGVLSR